MDDHPAAPGVGSAVAQAARDHQRRLRQERAADERQLWQEDRQRVFALEIGAAVVERVDAPLAIGAR